MSGRAEGPRARAEGEEDREALEEEEKTMVKTQGEAEEDLEEEMILRGRRALGEEEEDREALGDAMEMILRGRRARGEAGEGLPAREEAEEGSAQGAREKRGRWPLNFELKKWTFKIGKWGRVSSKSLLLFSFCVLNALDIERRYEWRRRRGKYRRASEGT